MSKFSKEQNMCSRDCEVQCGSFVCFTNRGYIWDKRTHSWVYDSKGKALRTKNRICDWEPREE